MSHNIDNTFIVGAVIRAMIDVLGILAHQIQREDFDRESLISVSNQPYITVKFDGSDFITLDCLLLDNVLGMLQMNQVLNDQFKKYHIGFILASLPYPRP